ncbi:hypothetical protein K2Q08_00570 [Patescibacteria group bacterium]|nr:hypothetical protein [Patescibacteria group bacterium]
MEAKNSDGYGVTKIALAILCVLTFGIFVAMIVQPFVALLVAPCAKVFPYLGCSNIERALSSTTNSAIGMLLPFIGMPWLLKRSYLFLSCSIVGLMVAGFCGAIVLKWIYNLTHTNENIPA